MRMTTITTQTTTSRLGLGSAIGLVLALHQPLSVQAADACEVTVEATDAMTFTVKEIAVPKTCQSFAIHLKHTGTLSKNIMGHNLVVSKQADQQAVLQDGVKAGITKSFVNTQDARVVAATTLIGGGEKASATLKPAQLDPAASYVFFCSFPGHASMMKGVLKLT